MKESAKKVIWEQAKATVAAYNGKTNMRVGRRQRRGWKV